MLSGAQHQLSRTSASRCPSVHCHASGQTQQPTNSGKPRAVSGQSWKDSARVALLAEAAGCRQAPHAHPQPGGSKTCTGTCTCAGAAFLYIPCKG